MKLRYVIIVILAALAVLVASWLGWSVADEDKLDFPTWLEAISTFTTFVAAVIAGIFAARAYSIEVDREARWQESQRRSQASLVAAWREAEVLIGERSIDLDGFEAEAPVGIESVVVKLRNASEIPVTNVGVRARITAATPDGLGMDREIGSTSMRVLEPSPEPIRVTLPVQFLFEDEGLAMPPEYTVHISIVFVDAADVAWERTDWGRLRETGK